jgi:hypothetical protein
MADPTTAPVNSLNAAQEPSHPAIGNVRAAGGER